VTLAASPASGSSFTGWTGACSGTGTCTVTMDAAKSVTATFDQTIQPPPACVVPKVKGKTLAAAKVALVRAHCRAGRVTKSYSKTVKAGRVISQKPGSGAVLANNATVNLVVSKGKAPRRKH
jgi:beta-lactam-binding protein with PASTA domain